MDTSVPLKEHRVLFARDVGINCFFHVTKALTIFKGRTEFLRHLNEIFLVIFLYESPFLWKSDVSLSSLFLFQVCSFITQYEKSSHARNCQQLSGHCPPSYGELTRL